MRVLSLDQSLTNAGIVIWEDGLVYDFTVLHSDKSEEDHLRIMYIVDNIEAICKEENIDVISLESLSFGSISTSVRVLAGLYYAIRIMAERLDIECKDFTPKSVKKFATGSGNAKKPDMWKALPENIKTKFENKVKTISAGKYDLADAYFIGKIYLENYK